MNRRRLSDLLLTGSLAGGLFIPPMLGGIFVATLVRGRLWEVRWRVHHTLMAGAAVWAVMVVVLFRPGPFAGVSYFGYLWSLPLMLTVFKPDQQTTRTFSHLIVALFLADLLFNCYSIIAGGDLLGRELDERAGLLLGARYGGLFAHSFYSGSISIAALVVFLSLPRSRTLPLLALFNLAAAGSWRLAVAAIVILSVAMLWRHWSRRGSATFIVFFSLLVVVGVVLTSGLFPVPWEPNPSNSFRIYAWLLAIDKLRGAELLGVGLPNTSGIEAITFEIIDENLIAESWYLGTTLAFGLPYTVMTFCALVCAYFGENFDRADKQFALLMPLVFIDMVAGEFFLGMLIYTWMWLLICSNDQRRYPMEGPTVADAMISGRAASTTAT
jgi:hypothetical protein